MLFAELIPLAESLRRDWPAHHDRNGRHALSAGGLRFDVDQPEAVELHSAGRARSSLAVGGTNGTRHVPDVVRRLMTEYEYQLKFVIDAPADCDEVETYLCEFPEVDRCRVLLMPQGIDARELAARAEWLEPLCAERGFVFCPRRHIEWFGHTRGT